MLYSIRTKKECPRWVCVRVRLRATCVFFVRVVVDVVGTATTEKKNGRR